MINSEYVDIESSDIAFPFDPQIVDPHVREPDKPADVPLSVADDESVFNALTVLVKKDPMCHGAGNKKSVSLVSKDGTRLRLRTTEQSLSREWFDRLVGKGNDLQKKIDSKNQEYDIKYGKSSIPTKPITDERDRFQGQLNDVKLDLETLDALVIPQYRQHLINRGYFDLRAHVEKNANHTEEALNDAADKRLQFFGAENMPVWMNGTVIVARVVKR